MAQPTQLAMLETQQNTCSQDKMSWFEIDEDEDFWPEISFKTTSEEASDSTASSSEESSASTSPTLSWADIDEEERFGESCISIPEFMVIPASPELMAWEPLYSPSPYDDAFLLSPKSAANPFSIVVEQVEEEVEEIAQEEQDIEETSPTPEESFLAYEKAWWSWISSMSCGDANGQNPQTTYTAPTGTYNALSFNNNPQSFISTTSPSISLWATISSTVVHHSHGINPRNGRYASSPFSRQSILAANACATVTPFTYSGPGSLLSELTGSNLQDAVTGYATKSLLPAGTFLQKVRDEENPHDVHLPCDPHWSILTIPRSRLARPYLFFEADTDHKLELLGGRFGRKIVFDAEGEAVVRMMRGSKLRSVECCYADSEHSEESEDSESADTETAAAEIFSEVDIGEMIELDEVAMEKSGVEEDSVPEISDRSTDSQGGGSWDSILGWCTAGAIAAVTAYGVWRRLSR